VSQCRSHDIVPLSWLGQCVIISHVQSITPTTSSKRNLVRLVRSNWIVVMRTDTIGPICFYQLSTRYFDRVLWRVSVCLFVCLPARISRKPHGRTSLNVLCVLISSAPCTYHLAEEGLILMYSRLTSPLRKAYNRCSCDASMATLHWRRSWLWSWLSPPLASCDTCVLPVLWMTFKSYFSVFLFYF